MGGIVGYRSGEILRQFQGRMAGMEKVGPRQRGIVFRDFHGRHERGARSARSLRICKEPTTTSFITNYNIDRTLRVL